ncbi:transposase [soil metagenome]
MSERTPNRRKNLRLPTYDYRQPGAYFITICTHDISNLFGRVIDTKVELNPLGEIVREEWVKTAEIREQVRLDAFVVMPNHFHGILLIDAIDPTERHGVPSVATHRVAGTGDGPQRRRGPAKGSVGSIVGQFNSQSARRINLRRGTPGASVWKRNYYEHVVRSDRSLERIREYIDGNPAKWTEVRYYVEATLRA